MSTLKKLALAVALGAIAAYFLDPDRGRRRRHIAADRARSEAREGAAAVAGAARAAKAETEGAAEKAKAATREQSAPETDQTLKAKLESEVFRDAEAPKGQVSVDVVDGVVTLRGEVEDEKWRKKLEKDAAKVAGVTGVKSLLHAPGETPENVETVTTRSA